MNAVEANAALANAGSDTDQQFHILLEALDKNPYEPEALNHLAAIYQTRKEWEKAIACLQLSLACDPYNILTHLGIAQSCSVIGWEIKALYHFNRAVEIDPHCPIAHVERGYYLRQRGFACSNAEQNWQIGLADHEWSRCLQSSNYHRPTRTLQPMWDGRPIPGKRLYIWHEQGHGDAIWAARDIKRAKEVSHAATVIVEVPMALARLFQTIDGVDQVIIGRSVLGFPTQFDEHISIMSLMHVLGTSPYEQMGKGYVFTSLPHKNGDPFSHHDFSPCSQGTPVGLASPIVPTSPTSIKRNRLSDVGSFQAHECEGAPARLDTLRGEEPTAGRPQYRPNNLTPPLSLERQREEELNINGEFKKLVVGFCWTGNPGQVNNAERSIPFELMRPLTDLSYIKPISLLHEDKYDHIPPKLTGDFLDTARRMETCDLVITTCTSVAHLAGAMEKPTWLLLHKNAWWGWFREIEYTPWYKSMRLFRQTTDGDWQGVIDCVKSELECQFSGQLT